MNWLYGQDRIIVNDVREKKQILLTNNISQ